MAADTLAPALLNYIHDGSYPDQQDVASASLGSSDLSSILGELKRAQNDAKGSIRSLSSSTAGDIDAWISQARTLQEDIQRSRSIAREIVAEAEAGAKLHADVEDKANKVRLLEKEVGFNETLTGTLEHVRYAHGLLQRTQEEAVRGDVVKALGRLEDAEASIAGLAGVGGSRAVGVLQQKAGQLSEGLVESATECWDALINVNVEEKRFSISKRGLAAAVPDAAVSEIGLEAIVTAVKGLGVFEELVQKLAREIDRAILRPRMVVDENERVGAMTVSGKEVFCSSKNSDLDSGALFRDLEVFISFLSSNLPQSVAQPLSSHLIPALANRLETHWLDPAIPIDISEMDGFQTLLDSVSDLTGQINDLGWDGAASLSEWVESAPRLWLTKRREAVLGEVRDWVFKGLRGRKTVERVETRMVKREDVGLAAAADGNQDEGGDDWDDAWDEDDSKSQPVSNTTAKQEDIDEDASAWDLDDDEVSESKDANSTDGADDNEDDAWGWGDEENSSQKPPSPIATKKSPPKPTSAPPPTNYIPAVQELTLRETFTTTFIPAHILRILQSTITDAQTLSGPNFSDSLIAPAASALYTLPTLALAIYRATAPTAYAKDAQGLGNMLIYNDSSWLVDQLRNWKASQPAGSKLRVDADVTALEQFAKRAYGAEMESQRIIVRDLLDGAQGFGNCTVAPFKQEYEGAVEGTVDRVRAVGRMWQGTLSQGALLQSLGSLLSTITGKMIAEILDLSDISEPESTQLKALCDKVSSLKSLFLQSDPSAPGSDAEGQDMTFIYCPSWLKFQYLSEILESSLADIKWMWKEGELSLEFGAEEVVGLVEALFAESQLRREAVREIRAGGGR